MLDQILPGPGILPGQSVTPRTPGTAVPTAQLDAQGLAFRQLLDESLRTEGGVKFSAHAMKRLESRGIRLGPQDVSAIEDAVGRAAAKGARDSLVLSGSYAMVVNIPSRTVVTAFDQQGLRDNVVTNIDSAVFVS
jgi:flagellar operon protein